MCTHLRRVTVAIDFHPSDACSDTESTGLCCSRLPLMEGGEMAWRDHLLTAQFLATQLLHVYGRAPALVA
jgi:hypothetical protein